MSKIKLKYLFKAVFSDGETYRQAPEDISLRGHDGSSSMGDIQEELDALKIDEFYLKENSFGGHTWSVDLKTGAFRLDDVPFGVLSNPPLPILPPKFKLIYYRTRTEQLVHPALFNNPKDKRWEGKSLVVTNSAGQKTVFPQVFKTWVEQEKGVRKLFVLPLVPEIPVVYCFGWQCTIANKNYQAIVRIA